MADATAVETIAPSATEARPIWLFLDSSGVGGIETHVRTLALSWRRAGRACEIVLLQDHGANPWLDQLRASGLEPRVLGGSLGAVTRAMRAARPAVVHTHGYKAGIFGRLAAKLTGTPVVATFHSGERGAFPVFLYQTLDEWTSFLGRRIAVSEPIRTRLPFSSVLVSNYVPTPETPPDAPLAPVVGFVGRLSPEKGPDLFCRLARAAQSLGIEWRVYGDGPMRAELEAAYGDVVRFYGVVADMPSVWPELGLLAMTSRSEGLPLAALEAGAAGLPLLATRVGALPKVIAEGETGWLLDVETLEADDFEGALAALGAWRSLDGAAQLAMRAACWRRIGERYSEAASLERILAEYRAAGMKAA